jgi:hypothetical protein
MKIKLLILLLFFFSKINAQKNSDTAKSQHSPIEVENKFILPEFKNQILDADKLFSKSEIQLLDKRIDSIFISTKLKLQVAFVTPEYYENNSSKFDLFTDSLSNKWNTDKEESRVILIVSMRDRSVKMFFTGNNLHSSFKNLMEIRKEKREPTDIEKETIENYFQLTNKVLVEEAKLGVNLKAKNYVKALNDYLNAIIKNSNLLFDMN